MACTTCGGPTDGIGRCLDGYCRAHGGNDGILNNAPKKKEQSSCWVATAYYGDPDHTDVELLRKFREKAIDNMFFGAAVMKINAYYHGIGVSKFGLWWAQKTSPQNKRNIVRMISRLVLKMILYLATCNNKDAEH